MRERNVNTIVIGLLLLFVMFSIGCGRKKITNTITVNGCQVTEVDGGSIVDCGETQTFIPNGQDGSDGEDGEDGTDGSIISIIDPCGNGPGHDEIVIVLDDLTALAWYKDLGLVVLSDNVHYVTTDSQQCHFKVIQGNVINL